MRQGDSNSITREYFEHLLIELRQLDSGLAETKKELFGKCFSMPIATAALSHLNNTCENGMEKMAEGAAAAGALCFSGMGEKSEIEAMCHTGASVIKIIKPHMDKSRFIQELKEAEHAGAFGVGMDIDHAFNGSGDFDVVLGQPMRAYSSQELKDLIAMTRLPFIIKGVLSVTDAKKAVEIGAAGIIVSHHHGIIDYAVPPLQILPSIKKAVNGSLSIFVDCCIERGADVFKALALGADAVCAGRSIMEPLRSNGVHGVRDALTTMNNELKSFMSRTGCLQLSTISEDILWKRD